MIMGWYNGIIYKPFDLKSRGATRGGRLGARPPLAPERGGRPPLQNEKKERMAKISITGIRKPIELL